MLWVDEPGRPAAAVARALQALRVFANQAAAALVSAAHMDELRFLADHDPLTRLLNRRAFVDAARRRGRARDTLRRTRSRSCSATSTASRS